MSVNITLNSVGSGYNRQQIDNNFQKIQEALQLVLGRTGTFPNQMEADLDVNGNDILNVGDLRLTRFFIDGQEVTTDLLSKGDKGWSPNLGVEADGARRVFKLVGWVGGEGDAPTAYIGQYLSLTGFTSLIANAIDVRGPQGASGPGSGDLVAAQNLNDVSNKATAFANIIQPATANEITNRISTVKAITPSNYTTMIPIGIVWEYTGSDLPQGFIYPYGQAISRVTYADYFAKVGTTYGAGDGSTTFNVPDLRGRVVAGKDNMGGVSADRLTAQTNGINGDILGTSGGSETHVLTTAQLAQHGHPWSVGQENDFDGGTQGGFVMETGGVIQQPAWAGPAAWTAGQTIGGAGSNAPHNNVQPTFILNKILFVGV